MKILYVTHCLPVGGAEAITVNYLLKMKERGENVCLLEIAHVDSFLSERIKKSGITYRTLVSHSFLERALIRFIPSIFVKRFNKILREIGPDVVHYHTVYRFIEKVDFPLERSVFTFHSRVERSFNIGDYVKSLFDRLSHSGLHFIAISSKIEQDIKKIYPCANYRLIPNGVNLEEIRKKRINKDEIRRYLHLPTNSFIIGQVGRFDKVKNHFFSIDVFRIIAQRNENAIMVFVGNGNKEETYLLKEKIDEYNLTDNVIFLGLREDATQVMCSFDALIHPSISESFSLVLIEAQANNIRCVASDNIPKEIICNNNCFQLSLKDSKEKWADILMGDMIREEQKNISYFDIENVIDQHINLYNSITN